MELWQYARVEGGCMGAKEQEMAEDLCTGCYRLHSATGLAFTTKAQIRDAP